MTTMTEHVTHTWVRVPPCVYCEDCNVRLYQGELPQNQQGKESIAAMLDAAMLVWRRNKPCIQQ